MSYNIYTINKGINRAIEFRGLKAQYIGYLASGLVGLLLGFVILYIAGVPPYICIGIVFTGGGLLFHKVYRLSKKYGQYGLLKKGAAKRIPRLLVSRTRTVFMIPEEREFRQVADIIV